MLFLTLALGQGGLSPQREVVKISTKLVTLVKAKAFTENILFKGKKKIKYNTGLRSDVFRQGLLF